MVQRENLTIQDYLPQNRELRDFAIGMLLFHYMIGLVLLEITSMPEGRQYGTTFLLGRWDVSATPISCILDTPSSSCIRRDLNGSIGIVGGYMVTDEISVEVAASLVEDLWSRNDVRESRRRESVKKYVSD